jgi:hypothetical protein
MPDSLARARAFTRLLDTAARGPGPRLRVGRDPVLGLVPGLGDVAGAVLSGYLVLLAARAGASRVTIVRMLTNVAIDTVGGALPLVGDAFDVYWKSNSRNLVLLERTVGVPATEGRGDPPASRLVVWGSLLALALLAAAGLALGVLVIQLAIHWASR